MTAVAIFAAAFAFIGVEDGTQYNAVFFPLGWGYNAGIIVDKDGSSCLLWLQKPPKSCPHHRGCTPSEFYVLWGGSL